MIFPSEQFSDKFNKLYIESSKDIWIDIDEYNE